MTTKVLELTSNSYGKWQSFNPSTKSKSV